MAQEGTGVGHLNIGTGIGDAQVYNVNPAIQQFTNLLATQKAKRDADNKQVNDIVSSYDPTGLRNDADKQDAYKQYSDWKQQAINAENERDPQKRAMAISQVREGFNRLNSFVGQSKQQGSLEKSIGIDLMKNRHNYTDDSIDKYKKSVESGINSGDVIKSPLDIERKVDPEKMDADYAKFKTALIKPTQWDNGTISTTDYYGKKIGTRTQNRGVAMDGDNGALHNMLNYVSAHDDFKKGLQDRYPNIQGGSEAETNALRTKQYMVDMGDTKGFYDTPKETHMEGQTPERPVRPTWIEDYNMHNYGTPNPPKDTTNEYVKTLSSGMRTGNGEQNAQQLSTIISSNPAYGHGITDVKKDANGNITAFTVPAKYKFDAKKADPTVKNSGRVVDKPAYSVYLDPDKPNEYDTKIANAYKDVTGDQSATVSKVERQKPQGQVYTDTKTQQPKFNHTFKASGGKSYKYDDLIKAGYTEAQIQKAIELGNLRQ